MFLQERCDVIPLFALKSTPRSLNQQKDNPLNGLHFVFVIFQLVLFFVFFFFLCL